MSFKYFCDSCGKEIDNPKKSISVNISHVTYFPDLCKECNKKVIELMYKYSKEYHYDDKE